MPYRLKTSGPLGDELARIVEEQIDRAVGEIDDPALDRTVTVHQVRKRCKKIRAVLRLARGPLDRAGAFDRENGRFRDIAAALSGLRDAEVMIETHDGLVERVTDPDIKEQCNAIRERLSARLRGLAEEEGSPDERLQAARAELLAGRGQVPEWTREIRGFKSLEPGLKRTYRRGRRAMNKAYEALSEEAFHDWRKRVKYHWYACRLLRRIWPAAMDARRREAGRLSNLLGDEHDLSVYRQALESEPEWLGPVPRLGDLLAAVEQRRTALRREAQPLGMRLYAEKPAALIARFRAYWQARRQDED